MKLTRRELAAAAIAPAALPQAASEETTKELEMARESLRRQAGALDKFPLPPETEPDFQFRA